MSATLFADTVCDITKVVVDSYIECTVAADPQYAGVRFEGNRGVNFEYWLSTAKGFDSLDSILSLTSGDSGYNTDTLDELYFYDVNDTMDDYASRMTSYFTPPHSGSYQFVLIADGGARLFVDGVGTNY